MSRITAERFRQVDALFDAALDLAPSERAAYVAGACGGDAALRDEVLELLRAHESSAEFLEAPAAALGAPLLEPQAPTPPPVRVGPFRVVRELGRGGMGVVYLAEREGAQFEQRVALKLVRHAGTSAAVVARFVEERRILARLEHPGIARLVDGGVTDDGLPWFAMELVDGLPLDAWCDARAVPLEGRLALFAAVCDAVQYAHEHLVVHRDLKPSNILVGDDGRLKLLDFGIAKLLDPLREPGDLAETRTGVLVLTPEYAAPEQLLGRAVSTATDTYALGVMLFQLLAGRRPYEVRGVSPAELERLVCEVVPPRPSTLVAGAAGRRLRGDLDTIVAKALHKEPARRYSSAAALADDVRRFLGGRPVLARPDGAAYRLRKFVRRNRAAVAASAVAALALLGATAISAAQMREAQRQRDAALLEVKRQQALTEVQTVLASDSRGPGGRPLTAAERIAIAERVLSRRYSAEPWLLAETLGELASRLYELGDRAGERRMRARALAIARAGRLDAQLAQLACADVYSLAYDDQLDSARAALVEGRTALARAGEHPDVESYCLTVEGQLLVAEGKPDEAVRVAERAVAVASALPRSLSTLQIENDLASVLRAAGRTREASTQHLRVIRAVDAMGYRGTDLASNQVAFLTSALNELGELATADSVLAALVEARGGRASADGMLTFLRGLFLMRLGALDSAEAWMAAAAHDTTEGAGGLSSYLPPALAQLHLEQGRVREARRALASLPRGTFVRRVNAAWFGARVRHAEGDRAGAARMLEDSLRAMRGTSPRPPWSLAMPYVTAAEWRLAAGDARGADSLARLALAAASVDSLALARSAWAGRAALAEARARLALGDRAAARLAAARAATALAHGMGAANARARAAAALRDSLR